MREILFRAKQKNWCELPKDDWWVEGYYAMMGVDSLIRHYIVQNCAVTKLFKNPEENMYFNDVEIDPETLCQYTGLKDKNGNRIWENDIVQTPFRRFVVTYFDGVWGDRDGVAMRESIFGEGGVVIRNVFDNPELME